MPFGIVEYALQLCRATLGFRHTAAYCRVADVVRQARSIFLAFLRSCVH